MHTSNSQDCLDPVPNGILGVITVSVLWIEHHLCNKVLPAREYRVAFIAELKRYVKCVFQKVI